MAAHPLVVQIYRPIDDVVEYLLSDKVCVWVGGCEYVCACVHWWVWVCVCARLRVCVCARVCVCVCVCVCVFVCVYECVGAGGWVSVVLVFFLVVCLLGGGGGGIGVCVRV